MLEIEEKKAGLIKRLTNKTFKFDPRYKDGFYSANYFLKTRRIVKENCSGQICTLQFFQRDEQVMLCGIDEVIALIQTFADNPEELIIVALQDGDIIASEEPVLKITGRYEDFGFLESAIDGILARRSSVATNCHRVINAANGKRILDMADRQDDPLTQAGDGYAAYVAGLSLFSTDACGQWVGLTGKGTMPHALIQLCGGDIVKASDYYLKTFPETPITALIDYHNNVVNDAVALAKHLQKMLKCVRVDTSKSLIDHWFDHRDTSDFDPHGVCEELIFALRHELDRAGAQHVEICVSSSFDEEKIRLFEENKVPVDIYGVGTSLIKNWIGFTGDLVTLNGKPQAKEGRKDLFSDRLEKVNLIPR